MTFWDGDYTDKLWDNKNRALNQAMASLQTTQATKYTEMDIVVADYIKARTDFKEIDRHDNELKALISEVKYLKLPNINMETANCLLSFLQDERLAGNNDEGSTIIKSFFGVN